MIRKMFEKFNQARKSMASKLTRKTDAEPATTKKFQPWAKLLPKRVRQKPQRYTPNPGVCIDPGRQRRRQQRRQRDPGPWPKGMLKAIEDRRRKAGRNKPNQRQRWLAAVRSGKVIDTGRQRIITEKRWGKLLLRRWKDQNRVPTRIDVM